MRYLMDALRTCLTTEGSEQGVAEGKQEAAESLQEES